MKRTLHVASERWPLARPFTISRGTKTVAEVVVAEIRTEEAIGRGECVPYPRYGETVDGVVALLAAYADAVAAGIGREDLLTRMPAGAARNALDCALWDLEAKLAGRPGWQLAGLDAPRRVVTAETIPLDRPAAMADRAAGLAHRPLLKVKLGGKGIIERMTAVRRAAPDARLIVDANEAWSPAVLKAVCPALATLGVEMIEQPLPAGEDAALTGVASPVPLCADESCHTAADLPRLTGKYAMINVKLDKAGGLTAALGLARAARTTGFEVMLGCMVATSLAMAPALLLASLARIVDLDGPLWLARDRTPPLRFRGGRVSPAPAALWGYPPTNAAH